MRHPFLEKNRVALEPRLDPEFAIGLGRAIMPEYRGIPAFDEESYSQFVKLLEEMGPETSGKIVYLLTYLRYRFSPWPLKNRKKWERVIASKLPNFLRYSVINRHLLRAATTPLKIAHYDSERVYRAIGLNYRRHPKPKNPFVQIPGVIPPEEFPDLDGLEIDALVVGSGAGGAVAAYRLAQAGQTVLIAEEGLYYHRLGLGRSPVLGSLKLYRNSGATFTIGNPPIYLPLGRSVGGTTTVNSGTCYRPPERVLNHWHRELNLETWNPEKLLPHLEEIEKVLQVEPAKWKYLGGVAQVIADGCRRLGYTKHGPLARNAPECDGQGICPFLCPTDAKRSTNVSFIPLALKFGAYITPGTSFISAEISGKEVTWCELKNLHTGRKIRIKPKKLFIAAGALKTPIILKNLGIKNRWVGKNLSIHPAASVAAIFDHPLRGDEAIPQGYGVEEFHPWGLLFEGAFIPLEMFAGAAPPMLWGTQLQELLSHYPQTALFGFMIEDSGKGRVLGELGDLPLVYYQLDRRDLKLIQKGMEILISIYLAAGAKRVLPQLQTPVELSSWEEARAFANIRLKFSDLDLSAYHPAGTARMAADSLHGVTDQYGRVFGLKNLYISDASVLPTSPAVNPQITIMAAASQIAQSSLE